MPGVFVRAVTRFFEKDRQLLEFIIRRELCLVYASPVMSQKIVIQRYCYFRNGRTNGHDEERSGNPTILSK